MCEPAYSALTAEARINASYGRDDPRARLPRPPSSATLDSTRVGPRVESRSRAHAPTTKNAANAHATAEEARVGRISKKSPDLEGQRLIKLQY